MMELDKTIAVTLLNHPAGGVEVHEHTSGGDVRDCELVRLAFAMHTTKCLAVEMQSLKFWEGR